MQTCTITLTEEKNDGVGIKIEFRPGLAESEDRKSSLLAYVATMINSIHELSPAPE